MPVKMVKMPVEAQVSIVKKGEPEKITKEKVTDALEKGPMANVGFSLAHTKNLGNYESVKVSISLHYPVPVSGEWPASIADHHMIDQVLEMAEKWVDAKMEAVVTEIDSAK